MAGTVEELLAGYAREAHAGRTHLVAVRGRRDLSEALGLAPSRDEGVESGEGRCGSRPLPQLVSALSFDIAEVRASDLRVLSADARACSAALIVDNSLPTVFGCRPLLHGAQVCFEELLRLEGRERPLVCAVSTSPARTRGHAVSCDPALLDVVDAGARRWAACLGADELSCLESRLEGLPGQVRARNDLAAVAAEYLRCHPSVSFVSYPGLAGDPNRSCAASVLELGFGPVVGFGLRQERPVGALMSRMRSTGCRSRLHAVRRPGSEAQEFRLLCDGADDPEALVGALEDVLLETVRGER